MSIIFLEHDQVVHIQNKTISYVMEVVDNKYLVHRYFGPCVRSYRGLGKQKYYKRSYCTESECSIENVSFDDFPFEYPTRGHGDYRIPAFEITQENGISFTELLFKEWKVLEKKPEIDGLPSTFADREECETLEIVCEDETAGIRVHLFYTIFQDCGIIARHQRIENIGTQSITLQNVQSCSLELPAKNYDVITLYGTHAKEGNINRFPMHYGIQKIESVRGSSSPQSQPFFAVVNKNTTINSGNVYAMHFVYSGNFIAQAEQDSFGMVRMQMGLNPDTFTWRLEAGENFCTPEVIINFSDKGLNGMSQNFHDLYGNHLLPRIFKDKIRPILLNSWESMYYDVNLHKIEEQCELAAKAGIELFVLDDGWFRKGNDSWSSMGDWTCNDAKLPGGISKVAEIVHEKGLQFGLWFEPEAVSEDSDLYRMHPDWALQIPGYSMAKGRHEYLLDLTREDVKSYIIDTLDGYLKDGLIQYIKWDMNRPLTDVNSLLLDRRQKTETSHRYILGLYEILGAVTKRYPEVLIEGCSSGGARFDPGMLYYVPQNWTSDNTDAYDRTYIQDGFSLLYPPVSMGAHVSIAPNHQTGRSSSLDARYQVAKLFNLGYELDLTKCTEEELQQMTNQIKEHKSNREWIQKGRLYHYDIPNDNYVMWSVSSNDKAECVGVIMQKLYNPLNSHTQFIYHGLDANADYQDMDTGEVYGGDELMRIGVTLPLIKEDFHVFSFHFKKYSHKG